MFNCASPEKMKYYSNKKEKKKKKWNKINDVVVNWWHISLFLMPRTMNEHKAKILHLNLLSHFNVCMCICVYLWLSFMKSWLNSDHIIHHQQIKSPIRTCVHIWLRKEHLVGGEKTLGELIHCSTINNQQ